MTEIGVLTLQGDYNRHIAAVEALGFSSRSVRTRSELSDVAALIIPGGESTTIGMLMERGGLLDAIEERGANLPIFGTCAGAILLAERIEESSQIRIGSMDITIRRNAYGRQVDSFEADLSLSDSFRDYLGDPTLHGVFIRAPIITEVGTSATVLSNYAGNPVVVRQGVNLVATFHPELAGDYRIHRYFIKEVAGIGD